MSSIPGFLWERKRKKKEQKKEQKGTEEQKGTGLDCHLVVTKRARAGVVSVRPVQKILSRVTQALSRRPSWFN